MELSTLNKISDLFRELEEKRFPNNSLNRISSMARQIGTMSVFISEKYAKQIIKSLERELGEFNND
jgi:hypothetical protein